jgi:hypothetical protein
MFNNDKTYSFSNHFDNWKCIAQSRVVCVVFCRSLFDFCPFSFGHCVIKLFLTFVSLGLVLL